MLGDAQTIVDGRIWSCCIHTRCSANFRGGNTSHTFKCFGGVLGFGDKFTPFVEALVVAARGHIVFGHQAFGDHHMGQRVDESHIGARFQGQVVLRLYMGAADQINFAGICHDEFGATAQSTLHARGKHRVGV